MNRRPRTSPRRSHPRQVTWELFALGFEACSRELETLDEYLSLTSEFLDKKRLQFQETFSRVAHDPDFVDAHYDDIQQLWEGFPAILNAGALVSACFCLEGSITDICKTLPLTRTLSTPCPWAGGSDRGIFKAGRFLRTNFRIHVEDHSSWHAILDYYRIRNCIAHASSDVGLASDQEELTRALARHTAHGIGQSKFGRLEIKPAFVRHVVKDMRAFWRAFQDAAEQNEFLGPLYWP